MTFFRSFNLWPSLILVSWLVLLTGCGERRLPVEHASERGLLLVGNGAEPRDLDPQVTTSLSAFRIHTALFEGLVTLRGPELTPGPGVATHWEVSEDGFMYTFHLRKDARWSNGEPVTAEDFRFSYQRILSPDFGAEYANLLYPLKNAEAIHNAELPATSLGVRVIDTHTLALDLNRPVPYFLSLLAHPVWYPVHPATILKHGRKDEGGTQWTRPGNLVSNGPFQLKTWSLNEYIELGRNPHYHSAGDVALAGIRYLRYSDENTEERAFLRGQLHVTYTVPPGSVAHWLSGHHDVVRLDPDLGTYYYAFNTTVPPLDKPLVRQALSLAIDRETIVTSIRQRNERMAHSFTPPGIGDYVEPKGIQSNWQLARQRLAEAGFPEGKGFPELELIYNESETHRLIAEAVQQMWQRELGIRITLRNVEWKTLLERRKLKDFQILRAGWIGDYLDPETFLSLWHSNSGNNHSGWSHARYDALLDEAATTIDAPRRYALMAEAESILLELGPIAPIFHYNRMFLKRPELQGWHPNFIDYRRWQDIRLEPKPEP